MHRGVNPIVLLLSTSANERKLNKTSRSSLGKTMKGGSPTLLWVNRTPAGGPLPAQIYSNLFPGQVLQIHIDAGLMMMQASIWHVLVDRISVSGKTRAAH